MDDNTKFLYRTRKKTNEELYESWMRSDFSSTITEKIVTIIEDHFCILWPRFFK